MNTVSKQSVHERITLSAANFAKQLLEAVIIKKSRNDFDSTLFKPFKKVLLQDSTTLKLPQVLNEIYVGNSNKFGRNSVARVQSIIDIKKKNFIQFVLSSFTQNDQSASGEILNYVSKGDLVLRDLGYAVFAVFEKLIAKQVDFLSRLKFGSKVYDLNKKELNMVKILKQNKVFDQWVYVGLKKTIKVRLVMLPLPKEQAAEKIRKAKSDRDRRLNHSDLYYKWLGYSIYITTVKETIWDSNEVTKAYKVRWQIEIIFKSWKSGFHLQSNINEKFKNEYLVSVYIFLMLMFLVLFMQKIYLKYASKIEEKKEKAISLLKLAKYVKENFYVFFTLPDKEIELILAKNCCYENRKNRKNMTQQYHNSET